MRLSTYEITVAGRAGPLLEAAFDDCQVTAGQGTTTVRAGLPGPDALNQLMARVTGLGLKVIRIRLLA